MNDAYLLEMVQSIGLVPKMHNDHHIVDGTDLRESLSQSKYNAESTIGFDAASSARCIFLRCRRLRLRASGPTCELLLQ